MTWAGPGGDETIRVLHVDDEPDFAGTVAAFLEREDERIDVLTATSVDDAEARLADAPVDCVVSDYDMPGRSGIEFLESLREEFPALPFVLYTGKGSEGVASEAISAGVTDYLQKERGTDQYAVLANRITNAVDHYRSQRALGERNRTLRRYERMVNSMREAACIYDTEGRFDVVNDYLADWYGTTPDELEGEASTLVSHVRQAEDGEDPYEALVDGRRAELHGELAGEFPDHGHAVVEYRLTPLTVDGAVEGVVGVARDITERKRRERELRRKERRYGAVFNDPNILVALLDTDGAVLDVNETAMAYVDAGRDEVVDTPFRGTPWFAHAEAIQRDVGDWVDRAASGEYVEFDADLVRPNGDPYAVQGVFRPVTDDAGDVVSLLVSARDVTARRERERELERYGAYLEGSTDIITVLDEAGRVQYESPSVRRILGYEPGELLGENGFEFVHPDDVDDVGAAFTDLLADPGATTTVDCRFRTADDEWRWLEINGRNRLDDPAVDGIIANSRDITERKQREADLERTNAVLSVLFESLPAGVLAEDESRNVLAVNERLLDLFGFDGSPDSFVGSDCERLAESVGGMFVEDGFVDRIDDLIDARAAVDDERLALEDGRTFERTHRPVELPGGSGQLWVYEDVTDRVGRERELERAHDLRERVERIADVGGWEIDPESREVFWTDHLFDILGIPDDEELPLEEALDVYHEDDRGTVEAAVERALDTGDPFDVEVRFRRPDGEVGWLRVAGVPIVDDGDVVTLRGAVQDITDRKRYERDLEHQNDRLEQFAAVVSHDLRNPLNVATGRLQLAREDADSPHLDEISRAHDRMEALIDDLLRLARDGMTAGDVSAADVAAVAEDCWRNVDTTGATLVVDATLTVRADEMQFRQLFENLIRNAVEHGSAADRTDDGADVTVTVGDLPDGFYVEDDGVGIPPEEYDAVFEPGHSTSPSGTGFGLSIVKQVAESHGWTVGLAEGSAGGARFEFTGVERVEAGDA